MPKEICKYFLKHKRISANKKSKIFYRRGTISRYGIGVGFHIGLHIRDLAVLANMKTQLGNLGKIYEYPNKNEAHYAITRKEELRQFIRAESI